MTIDELIEIAEAARAGKTIQVGTGAYAESWRDTDFVSDISRLHYRVKPGPREWTVRVYPQGIMSDSGKIVGDAAETIQVREVLP